MEHGHHTLFGDPRTWVAIAFVIFFVIFGKKIVIAVTSLLDKHGERVRAELDEATRLRMEAEILLRDARARRQSAETDAQAMLTNAQAEAARVADAAREDAAQAAFRRERMAMDRIAAAEKAAVAEVRQAAADVAAQAARTVIAENFGKDDDAALIDRAISGLPSALAGRKAA